MRFTSVVRFLRVKYLFNWPLAILALVLSTQALMGKTGPVAPAPSGPSPNAAAIKMLPDKVGGFAASRPAVPNSGIEEIARTDYQALAVAQRDYRSPKGEEFNVIVASFATGSGPYALVTALPHFENQLDSGQPITRCEAGTACRQTPHILNLFKGTTFIQVRSVKGILVEALTLAREIAATIPAAVDDEIPVLVKHLPNWESVQDSVQYIVSENGYKYPVGGPSEIGFELGFNMGVEAVVADYGSTRLLLAEHNTPQLATEADVRMRQRLESMRAGGKLGNTYYRRIGNYSAFVFGAPDEAAANQLFDQIAYEKTVKWLGENPYPLQQAQRNYTQTMGGVILAVIQGAGLALVLCGVVGGIVGGIVFLRRRKQQSLSTAFSDAGGMMRLNLDELTPQIDPSRLLDKGSG